MEADLGAERGTVLQVTNFPSNTTTEALTIHFQRRKNGGGEVESVQMIGDGVALVAFEEIEVAESVLAQKHTINSKEVKVELYRPRKLQIYDRVTAKLSADLQRKLGGGLCKLLEQVKYKTRVDWHEASDGFLLSGTLDQLIEVRTVIQQSLGKNNHKKILGVLSDTEKIFEGFNYSKKSSEQKTHLNQNKKQNAKSEKDTPEEKMLVSHEIHKPNNAKVSSIGNCNEATTMKSSVKKKSSLESRKTTDYKGVDRQQLNPMQTVSNNVSNPRNEAERLPCDSEKAQLAITASANCKSKMDGKKTIASSDTPDAKEEVVQRSCIIPAGMMRFLGHVHSEIFTNLEKCVDIQIQENIDTCKLTLMRKVGSESNFETKCKEFSSFYRQLKQKTHQKEIKLDKQRQIDDEVLQTVINDVQSGSLVLIDTSKDLNSLTIYGTFDNVTFAEEMLAEALHIKDVDKNSITVGRDNRLEYVTKTGIKLSVLKGDITMEISDVIVNAANERLVHGGGVAKAIVDKGGRGIQDESSHIVRSCGEVQPGKVAWTRAGALPCKGIIHAVGPRWKPKKGSQCKKILRSAVTESLLMASGLRMKSIAFPPISAGIFGMPPTISAKVMFDAALKFANNLHPTYEGISDIRFVVVDDPTFEVFKGEFITRFTDGDPYPKQFTGRSKGQSIVTENAYIDKKPDARSCLRRENRSADSYQGISKDKPDHGGVEMRTSVKEKHSNGENRPRNQSNQEQVNHKTLETNLSKSQSGEQKTLSSGSEKAVRVEEPVASSRESKQDSLPRGTSDTKAPYKRKTKNDESRGEDSEIEISKRNLGKEAKKASSVSDSSQFKFTIEEILLNPNVTSKNNNEKDTMEISTLTADISTSLIREPSPLTNPDNAAQSSDASNEFRNESNKIPWVTKERERQEARKGSTGFSPAEVDANKILEPGSLMQSENKSLNCSLCSTRIDQADFQVQRVCKVHNFCDDCLLKSLPFCNQCPVCHDVYGIFKNGIRSNGGAVSQREQGQPSHETVPGKTLVEVGTEETAPSKKLNHPSCKPTEPSLLNKEGKLHDGLPEALQHSRAGSKPRAGNKCSTQPPGHMTWSNYSQSLPGYDSTGTVAVTFAFYDGVQGEEHPHPGQPYKGTTLIVYLPNTSEGKQVLRLFRKVFDARLLFTVGCNHHRVDEIDWNGVRPKLCVNRTREGFPDPQSLQQVRLELMSKVEEIQ